MNINGSAVVSLQQLVPEHECLKLLILHTPYELNIDTLYKCVNLVKLDLSKNNLRNFPYLGDLHSLKIIFIHENKLDVQHLISIFQKNGRSSILAERIVWVTFWGNSHQFLGRHYVANKTKAIAFDKHMITIQEQSLICFGKEDTNFGKQTDISDLLSFKNGDINHSTEDEYLNQFWSVIKILRNKHQKLFGIIKIQKVFRGWIVRVKIHQLIQLKYQQKSIITNYFQKWKQLAKRQKKLRKYLQSNKKDYLLMEIKKMRKKLIQNRLIELACQAKRKVLIKKSSLFYQMKFYGILRHNLKTMKSIYQTLQVNKSNSIYILKTELPLFIKYVIPFVKCFNPEQDLSFQQNFNFEIRSLYYCQSKATQFVKMLQSNVKSIVVFHSNQKKDWNKYHILPYNIKYYGKSHFNTKKLNQIKSHISKLQDKINTSLKQLVKISNTSKVLRDITRGVYFFNIRRLSTLNLGNERINILTQKMMKRISSAIKIQRIWRGYRFRKYHLDSIKAILKMQRASIIIQRWVRRLPAKKRKNFIYDCGRKLNEIQQNKFYVQFSQYLLIITQNNNFLQNKGIVFLQQYATVYINKQTKEMALSWDINFSIRLIFELMNIKKILFHRQFIKQKIGLTDEQINSKLVYDKLRYEKCDQSFIFHYQTETAILSKQGKKYLQIKCKSKIDAKFRVFALMLLTLKNKYKISLFNDHYFLTKQKQLKLKITNKQHIFVCQGGTNFIKVYEQAKRQLLNPTTIPVNVKLYLPDKKGKLVKNQQRFFILQLNTYNQQIQKTINQAQEKKIRSQTEIVLKKQFHILPAIQNNGVKYQSKFQRQLKLLIRKRSVKQFKVERRNKKINTPSFMFDNSKQQRRSIQLDQSCIENINSRKSTQSQRQLLQKQLSKNIYSQNKQKQQIKKNRNIFIQKFVNKGNFIQNQFASELRKRIRTQVTNSAIYSAERIRQSRDKLLSNRSKQYLKNCQKNAKRQKSHQQIITNNQNKFKQLSDELKNKQIQFDDQKQIKKVNLKKQQQQISKICLPCISQSSNSNVQ